MSGQRIRAAKSLWAGGRITRMDTAAALAIPGVLAVITHENAPAMRPPRPSMLDLSLSPTTREDAGGAADPRGVVVAAISPYQSSTVSVRVAHTR